MSVPVEPAERGAIRIADRVVAKIASQAAWEALAGAPGPGKRRRPRAVVAVRDQAVRVRVAVELDYPSDIGAQCGAVRRRVGERVTGLAGMEVPAVAVTVERLHLPHLTDTGRVGPPRPQGRRGRVR
ncbi:hypothetical protein [Streptomyces sp. XD-27]|uniref:hypothetical protein n=1 Tax=Streptomyces sp. XD-27 TaxID=3062779 RepID=UPI0026F43349|nr:hypothetical protein [Streptomyces sp. XD-27]WKX69667.1 hypothetical protein Q3Y56_06885 [Streptomyces sp. XD-27]